MRERSGRISAKTPRPGEHSRRKVFQLAALGLIGSLTTRPRRTALAAPNDPPDIQFDVAGYAAPAESIGGTLFKFGPVHSLFVTAQLSRTPTWADQRALSDALTTIERRYPFSPIGLFASLAYGLPYFDRLPGGVEGDLVAHSMPRLLLDQRRYALEEAVPAPTDMTGDNQADATAGTAVPVAIERNDLLLTLRSDLAENLTDALAWLLGSGRLGGVAISSPGLEDLIMVTSTRLAFLQRGLPRRLAEAQRFPYAASIPPDSPMWMGFASQQADSSGPAEIVTFEGTAAARFTDTSIGDYFAGGAIQHLSHVILDLERWYSRPYLERVQNMFRSNPAPAGGNSDQFTGGGGPTFLPNAFAGRDDARKNAIGQGTLDGQRRLGHTSSLQRASRAADGTPIHIRIDGPGLDDLDVTDGSIQPKLHFSMFVPTAEVFERMRRYQSGADLAKAYGVAPAAQGLERFTTTTRRQNFLVPPRRHRAFPLVELG